MREPPLGRIGPVGGLFFGFAFGSGLVAALPGEFAERTSIEQVCASCAYLPMTGLLATILLRTR